MTGPSFPETVVLLRGVYLHAIVNATMTAANPEFARFLSWDGANYVLNQGDGKYGAITFSEGMVVGTFFDVASLYSPYHYSGQSCYYDINKFLIGMPVSHRLLADQVTLRYNNQQLEGKLTPVITAAFWNEDERLAAAFPWSEVLKHGARIIRTELIANVEDALVEWADAYEMSSQQIAFARSIFERRLETPQGRLELTQSETEWLRSMSEESEGMDDCKRAFEAMGIQVAT